MKLLEVCAADLESVWQAAEGGAARVELCSGLAEGGLTPSAGLLRGALKVPGIRVHVLIRPRPGDFLYTSGDADAMLEDVRQARAAGAHGVVIGALTPDGNIDMPLCRRLIDAAGEMDVTFHRAFDLCRAPFEALDRIIGLGCSRILTSGCAPSACEGIPMLRRLVEAARQQINILAGGGVTPLNARRIVEETGVKEVHASCRASVKSGMLFRREGIAMGAPDADEYSRKTTSAEIVSQICQQINP